MKKIYKILLLFMFLFILFTINKTVKANSIEKITMEINVDNNGKNADDYDT